METTRIPPDPVAPQLVPAEADDEARERAEHELSAAIAMVARDPAYRVVIAGMATSASLLADLGRLAEQAGVVLERRIRAGGGGFEVLVRAQ